MILRNIKWLTLTRFYYFTISLDYETSKPFTFITESEISKYKKSNITINLNEIYGKGTPPSLKHTFRIPEI